MASENCRFLAVVENVRYYHKWDIATIILAHCDNVKQKSAIHHKNWGDSRVKVFSYNGQRNISGEKIRQERTRQRCTQSDLAARIQVSGVILERDCISRIENGLRMVQDFELRAIAGALGVTTDWLLEAEQK